MRYFKYLTVFLCFVFFNESNAQYTLSDEDVEVLNGIIVKCTYNYANRGIRIPDS